MSSRPPGRAGRNGGGADTAPGESVSFELLLGRIKASVRDNWRLGVLAAALVLVMGVPYAFIKGKRIYGATAVVQVNPRFQKNLTEDVEQQFQSNSQYRQYVQQQVMTMGRLDIGVEALSRLGDIPSSPQQAAANVWRLPGEPVNRAATRLIKSVQAYAIPDTYLINVNIESGSPKNLAKVLNTYIDVFLEHSRNEEFYGLDQRLNDLGMRQSELDGKLGEALKRRAEIAQELGVTTFSERVLNPFDALVIDGTRTLDEARRKRLQAESTVAVFVERSGGAILNSMVEDLVAKDYGINALKANLHKRRADLISEMSGLEPSHPLRKSAEAEVEEIDQEIRKQSAITSDQQRRYLRDKYIADAEQAKLLESRMEEELTNLRARASEYTERYQEALRLQTIVNRYEKELEKIDERVNSLKLESQAPGFVRWSTKAAQDNDPVSGGRVKWLLIVCVASIVAFFGGPILIAMLDRRVHHPADLQSILGFSPMGWLLRKNHPGLDAFAKDLAVRVAIRLRKDFEVHQTRTFALMGSKSEVGVSTLIAELAHLLRSMNLTVGVINLNAMTFSKPVQDNVPTLDLEAWLQASIHGHLPDMPPIGEQPLWQRTHQDFAINLNNLSGLRGVLDYAAKSVDIILLDSPPLLLSGDAELIASDVDCAVLVARAGHCIKPDLRRAVKLLERANPPAVSAVLMDVSPRALGHVFDDVRAQDGLPPEPDLALTIKAIIDDPMLISVMINSWWLHHGFDVRAKVIAWVPERLLKRLKIRR